VRYVRAFGRFWWDFIVGDDVRSAAALAVLLAVTWLLTDRGLDVWWLLPVGVAAILIGAVRRLAYARDRH
jgi:hypothetical protein